jgi:putative hydrolase of the HAD superfamily
MPSVQANVAAVLFDFGGVITASPFDAFNQYERELGLPEGSIRNLNATNPHTNAWAQLERNEVKVDDFCRLFEAEARAAGHELSGQRVLDALNGEIRPDMVEAVRRCSERLKTACLTNNIARDEGVSRGHEDIMALFDVVIESSKIGVRKPDPRFYEIACAQLAVEPRDCVFLDDLGINLKPARVLGMRTIKVENSTQALAELEQLVSFPLRD